MGAHLCMDHDVVEKYEPVDGEPPSVLQSQSFVAALADQPAVGLPQRVLATHDETIQLQLRDSITQGTCLVALKDCSATLPSFCQGSSSRNERNIQHLSVFSSAGESTRRTGSSCPAASGSHWMTDDMQTNKPTKGSRDGNCGGCGGLNE